MASAREWQTPRLIVVARGRAEEKVLTACKYTEPPNTGHTKGCGVNSGPCAAITPS
jgi:hypothetical protein